MGTRILIRKNVSKSAILTSMVRKLASWTSTLVVYSAAVLYYLQMRKPRR